MNNTLASTGQELGQNGKILERPGQCERWWVYDWKKETDIWAITHTDGRNIKPFNWSCIPPVRSAQEGDFLFHLELLDEVRDICFEKGHWCGYHHHHLPAMYLWTDKRRSDPIIGLVFFLHVRYSFKSSPSSARCYHHRPHHKIVHVQDRAKSRPSPSRSHKNYDISSQGFSKICCRYSARMEAIPLRFFGLVFLYSS